MIYEYIKSYFNKLCTKQNYLLYIYVYIKFVQFIKLYSLYINIYIYYRKKN